MKRQAFLLGLFSISGQVLLLRELIRTFHGNELFIGTALFGWLIAVAFGAYMGGKLTYSFSPAILFIVGVLLLPVMIIITRLFPHFMNLVVGEYIPLSTAFAVSTLVMLPIGFLSGWLFPVITHQGRLLSKSVARVYLYEGIGAFVGGIVVLLVSGGFLSTLQTAGLLAFGIIAGQLMMYCSGTVRRIIIVSIFIVCYVIAHPLIATVDRTIEKTNYQGYNIVNSFDTHYSHQTILSRDSSIVLLTDNTIEAVFPQIESAEYMLIPPLAYLPDTGNILILGGSRLQVAAIADSLPYLSITIVDPRKKLHRAINNLVSENRNIALYTDDPVSYVMEKHAPAQFDLIIINPGELDSYKNSRFITNRILSRCRQLLSSHGILYIPTHYDTDRYISYETAPILAAVSNTLQDIFNYVTVWPGTNSLFFASQSPVFDISYDSLITNLSSLTYKPQYVNDYYLSDRLNPFRLERIHNTLQNQHQTTTFIKPYLLHLQSIYRAKANKHDARIIPLILSTSYWLPLAMILAVMGGLLTFNKERRKSVTLFLYFIAGLVSLSLELLVFYTFQSTVGTLYSEIAVLIGAFMLGLAFGTMWALHYGGKQLAPISLLFLLSAVILFAVTFNHIPTTVSLLYFGLFLFAAALATGGLFVGATNHLYHQNPLYNPGSGYALEILGSSLGALFTTTLLLPIIGLYWLLVLIAGFIMIAFVAARMLER